MSWESGTHGSTFGGNPVSCEASLATLNLLERGLMTNASKMGAYLKSELKKLKKEHPLIGDVRGIGLMIGAEFVIDRKTRQPASRAVEEIVQDAFRKGLLLLACGESVIRFAPPLIIDRAFVDKSLDIFSEVLSHKEKEIRG